MSSPTSPVMAQYFGKIDFNYSQISPGRQDFFRLLISAFGHLSYAPVCVVSAINGMCVSATSFLGAFESESEQLNSQMAEIVQIQKELKDINLDGVISTFSLRKKRKVFLKWQLFEFIHAHHAELSIKTLELVGAYFFMKLCSIKTGKQIPTILFKLCEKGYECLNPAELRALLRLEINAKAAFSEDGQLNDNSLSFSQKIRFYYQQQIHFADSKTRQAVLDFNAYPRHRFLEVCRDLKRNYKNEDKAVIIDILSMMTSLPIKYVLQIPFLSPSIEDWALTINLEEGTVCFDLNLIAPDGEQSVGHQFNSANNILVKPLPMFVWNMLKTIVAQAPISNLGEICKTKISSEYSSVKLRNAYSRVAAETQDLVMAGYLANDFKIFPSSKIYYHQSSRQDIWNASKQQFNILDWGEPAPVIEGLNFGSTTVLTDSSVTELFKHLGDRVESSRPSNNSSIENLLAFHEAYTEYCATLAIFTLCLRDANPLQIYASDVLNDNNFIILNDKDVHGAASAQPVTICKVLKVQFELYGIHCNALMKRLTAKSPVIHKTFIQKLSGIISASKVPVFVTPGAIIGLSSNQVSKSWPFTLPVNFGRHYWESNFGNLGISDRECATHLRHQSNGNLNWSSASDFVLAEVTRRVNCAQTTKLQQLNTHPLAGLVRRLK